MAKKSAGRTTRGITRAEFTRLEARVDDLKREFSLQFTRMAQLQAELDQVQAAWAKRKEKVPSS